MVLFSLKYPETCLSKMPFRSRNWDQFEANKALFGVETTFDEELYTTKLVRGPQLREREREAQRIALEIVGQQTRNVHLAEVFPLALKPVSGATTGSDV